MEHLAKVLQQIKPSRDLLLNHRLYQSVKSIPDTKVFMKNHIFAVWDFMSLLKSMQLKLTGTKIPWVPCNDRVSSYFVNSIVLAEESDDLSICSDSSISHYELYLEAMAELGGFSEPIEQLIIDLKQDKAFAPAIKQNMKDYSKIIPISTFEFTRKNLEISTMGNIEQVTSFFIFGREDPIPEMFTSIIKEIDKNNIKAEKFKKYLDRHVTLDGDEHGPMSMKLLCRICGNDSQKWNIVLESALEAIQERIKLWDGILLELEKKPTLYETAGGFNGIYKALSEHREDIIIGSENLNNRVIELAKAIGSIIGGPSYENKVFNAGKLDYEEAGEVIGNEVRIRNVELDPKVIAMEVNKMKGLLKARV
jgi:hypothetical protein